jgi:cytochrome oxidase Cu insertion factor (SCO1/SenC/PrrC family)
MAALQRHLETAGGNPVSEVTLVSFSVDPAHDTPAVLQEYARRFGALPGRWLFLTGEPDPIRTLVREGFRLSVEEAAADTPAEAGGPITHSDRFVLVDRALRIRGYFHGTDEGVETRILGAIARLRAEAAS